MLIPLENSRGKIIANNFNAISSTKSGQFRYFLVKSVSWGLTDMLMYVANGLVMADANPSAFIDLNQTQADEIILLHPTTRTYWLSTTEHSWQHLGLFHNVSRTLHNILSKFMYCRNFTCYENFKLNLCTCAQSNALGTSTNVQL